MPVDRFAAAYAALMAGHEVGDHWSQTDRLAVAKGRPDRAGAVACAEHVATYTATQAVALAAVSRATGARFGWKRAAAGLAVSAVTHYVADRQGGHWRDEKPAGVVKLAAATGHAGWLSRDPNAGYLMDQAWHKGWILVAALVIGGRS